MRSTKPFASKPLSVGKSSFNSSKAITRPKSRTIMHRLGVSQEEPAHTVRWPMAKQISLGHHPESDNCEVMIKRVGETYSRTLHDHEAGCVDRGQFVEIGAPEIFPRPLQIAELARKDFQSPPPRHPFLPRQSDIPVRVAIEKRE